MSARYPASTFESVIEATLLAGGYRNGGQVFGFTGDGHGGAMARKKRQVRAGSQGVTARVKQSYTNLYVISLIS